MFAGHNDTVSGILLATGHVSASLLSDLNEAVRRTQASLAGEAVKRGIVSSHTLFRAVAAYLETDYVEVPPSSITPALAAALPGRLARRYGVVPFERVPEGLRLLAVDPLNPHLESELGFSLSTGVEVLVCDPEVVALLLEATYGDAEEETLEEVIASLDPLPVGGDDELSASELFRYASDTPVIRLVDLVLERAIREGANDIHFEPFEDVFRIRFRVDGMLHEITPPPPSLSVPVASRLKVLAELNIAERRVPQDGRIRATIAGRPVDMRVSTLPTQYGESIVLRVLDKSAVRLDLSQLGMPPEIQRQVSEAAHRANGIFIVTGPTGSGKTTTLYSALREVNRDDTKILTAEDPVEYEIDGLVQTAVNPAIGLSFARALRAFLRQDPDKLLVGEIRDLETARVAAQAALTGHLVFTTLHTNDAVGAISRLVDMGLERYLIAASLEAVLAQRLVRGVCPQCREHYPPDRDACEAIGISRGLLDAESRFVIGRGCPHCRGTGYAGRVGLFEMMRVTEGLRERVSAGATSGELREMATADGMCSLRQAGIDALLGGKTTVEEIMRHT